MAKQPKPTKQQIAQAKARAGGNNPIKVTDAGLKKLGKVAVTAATMLPAGRAVKAVVTAKKAATAAKVAKNLKKADQKLTTEVIQSRSVRTRPQDNGRRLQSNVDSYSRTVKAKTGIAAREGAKKVESRSKSPAKVVKINSKNK